MEENVESKQSDRVLQNDRGTLRQRLNNARRKHSIHLRLCRSASTLLNVIRPIHSVQVTPGKPFKNSAQIDPSAKGKEEEGKAEV